MRWLSPLRNQLYLAFLPLLLVLAAMVTYSLRSTEKLNLEYNRMTEMYRFAANSANQANLALSQIIFALNQIQSKDEVSWRENLLKHHQSFTQSLSYLRSFQTSQRGDLRDLVERVSLFYDQLYAKQIQPVLEGGGLPVEMDRSSQVFALDIERSLSQFNHSLEDIILQSSVVFQEEAKQSFIIIGGGFVLAIVTALLVSYLLASRLVRPIENFRNMADRIREGDLEGVSLEKSCREFELLSQAINKMTTELSLYRDLADQKVLKVTNTLRTLLERSPDPTLFFDANLSITYQNPLSYPITGGVHAEAIPLVLAKLLKQAIQKKVMIIGEHLDDAITITVDDVEKHFLPHIFPIESIDQDALDESKDADGLVVILQDITLLHLGDQLKNDLLATVSHELKTPLTSARMSLYLLQEESVGRLNDEQASLVDTALMDLNRQLNTIQNLLDLSRVKNSQQVLHCEMIDLNALVRIGVDNVREMATRKGLYFSENFLQEQVWVYADAPRLSIVIENLLTNAIKHSPEAAEILVSTTRDDEYIRVKVKDYGSGIAPELQQRIFDKFFQESAEQQSGRGAGLGLYISKEIAEAHQGDLSCYSQLKRGSIFTLSLPRLQEGAHSDSNRYNAV